MLNALIKLFIACFSISEGLIHNWFKRDLITTATNFSHWVTVEFQLLNNLSMSKLSLLKSFTLLKHIHFDVL